MSKHDLQTFVTTCGHGRTRLRRTTSRQKVGHVLLSMAPVGTRGNGEEGGQDKMSAHHHDVIFPTTTARFTSSRPSTR